MDFNVPEGSSVPVGVLRCLVPFADMINGSLTVPQCHILNLDNQSVQIIAGKDYIAGEQVLSFVSR